MVQDSLPPERRGMGSAIIQLIQGTFNTPGPVIAGFLLLQFGLVPSMRIVYFIMTALFLTAAVWRLRLKETMTNGEPLRFSYFVSSYPKAVKESFAVWKVVPRSVLWLFAVRTLVMFGISLTNVINALYARDLLGITKEQWDLTFVPLLLTMVVASIPIGKVVDKVGRKIPLILGLCFLGAGTAIFVNGTFSALMISMSMFGIAMMLTMSASMALSADLVRPANRGKVAGFNNFVGYIVMGLGMLLGNYLYVSFVPQSPFYATLGLTVAAFLIVLFLIREPEKQADAITSA